MLQANFVYIAIHQSVCLFASYVNVHFIFLIEFLPKLLPSRRYSEVTTAAATVAHMTHVQTEISNCSLFQEIHSKEVNNKLWFGSNIVSLSLSAIQFHFVYLVILFKWKIDFSFNFAKAATKRKFTLVLSSILYMRKKIHFFQA